VRTSVLVLGILGGVFSLMVGLCTGVCFSAVGDLGESVGDTETAAEANAAGGKFVLFGLIQAIVGIVGTVKAYRTFEEPDVKKVPVYYLGAAAFLSVFNTMQFFTSGLLFGVAILLIFIGGAKAPTDSSGQTGDSEQMA